MKNVYGYVASGQRTDDKCIDLGYRLLLTDL